MNVAQRLPTSDIPIRVFGFLKRYPRFVYLGTEDRMFRHASQTEIKLILRNMVRVGMLEVVESPTRFIEPGTQFRLSAGWCNGVYMDISNQLVLRL